MCAINPTHKKRLILDVYTSHPTMTKEEFELSVLGKALAIELDLNSDGVIRWHLKETDQQAD